MDKNGETRLDKNYYLKNPFNDTELYIGGTTKRFAVYTENIVLNESLKDCTEAVLITLEKDMMRTESPKTKTHLENYGNETTNTDFFNIIYSIRNQKNGAKFQKLYDDGDFSDYGSHSEADFALCCMIAFRVGNNPDLIDTIFRKSALYRDKWERDDYREATISLAIAKCGKTINKNTHKNPPFILEGKKGKFVSVPLLAKYVRENVHYLLVRDNGKQAVQVYVYEKGVYKLYDEKMFKGVIKDFIAEYDEKMIKMQNINEAYQNILTDRNYISQDELNSREDIINFRNGLLIIHDNELKLIPHTPSIYSTIQIPCDWTEKQKNTPLFDEYIKRQRRCKNIIIAVYGCLPLKYQRVSNEKSLVSRRRRRYG